jgi:hypothetical protein
MCASKTTVDRIVRDSLKGLNHPCQKVVDKARAKLVDYGLLAVEPLVKSWEDGKAPVGKVVGGGQKPVYVMPGTGTVYHEGECRVRKENNMDLVTPYRDAVERLLEEIGGAAVPTLSDIAMVGSTERRIMAVRLLGRIHDPRALETLVSALGDPELDVREVAAAAVPKLGKHAVSRLIDAIEYGSVDVREAARAQRDVRPQPAQGCPDKVCGSRRKDRHRG